MNEDILIKSVLFGGFDKNEVLKHIEKIQSEHYDESETIKQKDEKIEVLKENAARFEDKLASEGRRFSALAALNDEYCERIYNLEEQIKDQHSRFESIQEDCDRLKKVEAQIGALLVDAVLYSDKMTEKAKTAATNITADAKNALVSTAEGVSELSTEIVQISNGFGDDITALVEKVESLSASLSLFADRFESECDVSDEKAYDAQEVFEHFFAHYNEDEKDVEEKETEDLTQANESAQVAEEGITTECEPPIIDEMIDENEHDDEPEFSDIEENVVDVLEQIGEAAEEEVTDIWDYKKNDDNDDEETDFSLEHRADEVPDDIQATQDFEIAETQETSEPGSAVQPEQEEYSEVSKSLEKPEDSKESKDIEEPEKLEESVEFEESKDFEQSDNFIDIQVVDSDDSQELNGADDIEELPQSQTLETIFEPDEVQFESDNVDSETEEIITKSSQDISESDIDELLRLFSNDTGKAND